jgi:molybdenum cofactor synthesis domain-containing protein
MAQKTFKAAILTISDRCARGEREDESGPAIREFLPEIGATLSAYEMVSDDLELIAAKLRSWRDKMDLIITTGGTGVASRDVTPEATRAVIEKELPGFGEAMRAEGLKKTPHSIISRGVCGISGKCLIVNLPGSPKAVKESLSVILPAIPHTIGLIRGEELESHQPKGRR